MTSYTNALFNGIIRILSKKGVLQQKLTLFIPYFYFYYCHTCIFITLPSNVFVTYRRIVIYDISLMLTPTQLGYANLDPWFFNPETNIFCNSMTFCKDRVVEFSNLTQNLIFHKTQLTRGWWLQHWIQYLLLKVGKFWRKGHFFVKKK